MGYQRRIWRSLSAGGGGGGGGVAVVRCSISEEEVRISFRSVGEERRLRRGFPRRWLESPRLSTASVSSNERAPSATPSDSSEPRPLSLISTLSSGSGSSRDENATPPTSTQTPDPELDSGEVLDNRGRSLGLINNNKNKETPPTHQQTFIMAPQLTYLDRVVMEIIETERMYVRDLRMIVEDYLAHIIDQCDLSIRPEQVCALFGNIEDIYEFNSELLQALDMCDNDPVAVARCFVMKSEYFEIYTQYCTNYPNSVAALTECMRSKSLAKFFRERQASLKRSLPLGSYLLKPVQRILKYHLLLQEIAKHFDPLEEGYEVVEEAIYTMTGVAWYINDMKRKHEHAVRLQEVQSLLLNWKGHDLTTYGELVLEGTFKVHRAKNERTLFLFDRMLLITKRRGEHFVYKTHISCSTLMLIESAKDSLSFSVTHYKHPKQPHTVQARTVEEKKLWAHHIKRAILENHHAVIPQKAKDAILEMNPTYPPRYRYSPERLKKASSCQSDDFPQDGRQGRRQSDPNKPTVKSSRDITAAIKEAGGGKVSADISNKENVRVSEEEEVGGAKATREQISADKTPQKKTSESKLEEKPKPEPSSVSQSLSTTTAKTSVSPQRSELNPERDPEHIEERLSATPDSDAKTLSSAESSEDEEDEKGATEKEGKTSRILPSSVLDKASVIAQHFNNSIRRGSQDDARSLGCATPRLLSRNSSSISLCPDSSDRRPNSASSDPPETFGVTDLTLLSPRDDSLFETDRGIRRRRDSTLSKQDQLLIGKIKSYYENAESRDATFSLQRRESLTYIPTGLVRSSVSRFNSSQKDDPVQPDPSTSTTAESSSALPTETQSQVSTNDSVDHSKSDQTQKDPEDSGGKQGSRSQGVQDNPLREEEFRPSSEMIKIWQTMEKESDRSQSTDRGLERSRKALRNLRAPGDNFSEMGKTPNKICDRDLGTITEESVIPVPLKHKASDVNQTGHLADTSKTFREEAALFKAPVPRVAQLRAELEGERRSKDSNQLEDADKTKSKVLHLARQYSQRIKTPNPEVRQSLLISKRTLPCVVEEKESTGKPNLTLPLVSQNQSVSLPMNPVDQDHQPTSVPTSSSLGSSSKGVSPGWTRTHSPLSPSTPTEGFNWPDVSELRSKYSNQSHPQNSSISRSRSIPEQMSDSSLRRHSSYHSSLPRSDDASGETSFDKPRGSWDDGAEERNSRLLRANSLDPRLCGEQMTELQKLQDQADDNDNNGYYIAAEANLPSDPEHKIIIMQKLPQPVSEPAEAVKESKEEEDDSYIQIRSPTSREKISIMAVIDRCRAYQESDEYQQREGMKTKADPARPHETDTTATPLNDQDDESAKTSSNCEVKTEAGQQSIVKNLREKFQSLS
ncbi:pleckstrin homology domain-containing family G member 3-like [Xyrichtys novacula]|uniref:Pleckstrin homology domain-containing family G member 3-like n=1 Tax=Xyrichtys novacula TaxID=13765 RepID=A0AAV1GVK5_XYRNO|nr:pleckstrin homology domain-containing family G member 3-like [Xyrichtys novacula]